MSADGRTLAWLNRNGDACELTTAAVAGGGAPQGRAERASHRRAGALARRQAVAYQSMTNVDWEIYVADQAGTTSARDARHPARLLPRFLTSTKLLAHDGRAAAPPLARLRPRHRGPPRGCFTTTRFAPSARVHLGAERRRVARADSGRARRRHGLGRARRLRRRPDAQGHGRRSCSRAWIGSSRPRTTCARA